MPTLLAQVSKAGKHHVLASLTLDGDVPPAALPVENAPPASAVIARLGDLERLVHLQLALTEGRKAAQEAVASLHKTTSLTEGANKLLEAAEANGNDEGSPTAAGAADVAMAPTGLLIAGRDELPEDPDAEPVQDAPETVIAAAASGCVLFQCCACSCHTMQQGLPGIHRVIAGVRQCQSAVNSLSPGRLHMWCWSASGGPSRVSGACQ